MHTQFYTLRALTPLHAGAGDANFGIIDKHVQRDSLTELPTIFASSIKGSLRQLCEVSAQVGKDTVRTIFGSDNPKGEAGATTLQQGQYIFYQAKLLALPIRSSHELYYLAVTPPLLRELLDDLALYGGDTALRAELEELAGLTLDGPKYYGTNHGKIQLEDISAEHAGNATPAHAIFGDRLAVVSVDTFARLAQELPTVARNSLNNGISENLWYEEIVPRESRFYLPITAMTEQEDLLNQALSQVNNLVQIGGNATVGFGLCQWEKLY